MQRKTQVVRKTKETDITLLLNLDGKGIYDIKTSIPFLDHMLSLFAKHGLFDLKIKAKGDIEIDYHHTVEDIGICLGDALKKTLGNKTGIKRYGSATVPMDEAIASVSLDISDRPYLVYKVALPKKSKIKNFDIDIIEDFFQAVVSRSGITLHVGVPYGRNIHHMIEAVFKAIGRALNEAVTIDPRIKGVMSTKGKL
ncbi:MAG: imidazoleglycerol-phosphate dehydratase [Deltaproteobacteria bacterium RIFCSPLOWO2_12_FULL_43_16]|nr:MAG: imidazoleglycerol-phosphate dehydratase [Deltaproteobacteria bacterium GWA2_43_19]OGQ12643.1 MAG: imidazoleglycerol-phosphate dehydratase [Deltaproteobacteria bacterium RIFCSPHIGHO2_02_FULL_43_33]OGQ44509.1 MAG: imidazoleglycerol-phosphate dehydratase [Deltaproteobacteria bacterium RIFCSPLOWO2_01_FULL_42_9]OGQ61600.1 MAG: imidazoleglycerol-phosphate dehydratase [Deltaproteobacteria bacterium RIFCSPLOWO2_12_FULL_43_16]HBR16236.1 imidazoleglycerol-phosphate dehydratase HisB [Deltaproteoba